MTEAKPLDLEDWIKEIKEKAKKLEKEIKNGWKIERSGFSISIPTPDRFVECKKKEWEVVKLYGMLIAIKEIKSRIKSACEFYLRYKDNPDLLLDEYKEIDDVLSEEFGEDWLWQFREDKLMRPLIKLEYNEWLFKLAFKGVFE